MRLVTTAPWREYHGQLWSLWDMLSLKSKNFLLLMSEISFLSGVFQTGSGNLVVNEDTLKATKKIVALLKKMDLPVSLAKAKAYQHILVMAHADGETADIAQAIKELSSRVHDELEARH